MKYPTIKELCASWKGRRGTLLNIQITKHTKIISETQTEILKLNN